MTDNTKVSGPLFVVRADDALLRFAEQCKRDIADEGDARIHVHLGSVLREDTGRYDSHVHTEQQVDDIMITDTPIVYGPWPEGTGSRNFPKTRFPGYFTFRIVSQGLNDDAEVLAQ